MNLPFSVKNINNYFYPFSESSHGYYYSPKYVYVLQLFCGILVGYIIPPYTRETKLERVLFRT